MRNFEGKWRVQPFTQATLEEAGGRQPQHLWPRWLPALLDNVSLRAPLAARVAACNYLARVACQASTSSACSRVHPRCPCLGSLRRRAIRLGLKMKDLRCARAAFGEGRSAAASLVTLEQSVLPGFVPPKPLDRLVKGAGAAMQPRHTLACALLAALPLPIQGPCRHRSPLLAESRLIPFPPATKMQGRRDLCSVTEGVRPTTAWLAWQASRPSRYGRSWRTCAARWPTSGLVRAPWRRSGRDAAPDLPGLPLFMELSAGVTVAQAARRCGYRQIVR